MDIFATTERFNKFDKFIESCDFEKFFYKLILEHDEQWFETCSINGKNPELTNKLKFIFNYLEFKDEQLNTNEKKWEFKKFIFFKTTNENNINYKIQNVFDNKIILEI
jgi:hypothetical protein